MTEQGGGGEAPNGVLPVDKPVGPTSHDAVAAVRRALKTREVGHTGTLDPFASGLLLVCVGRATRLAEYLTGLPKTYVATMRLGEATDTDDLMGEVIQSSDAWRSLSADAIEQALRAQVGTIQQLPPSYSAKKVGGERMYAAARRGEAVERKPVAVTIHAIRVLRIDLPDVELEVECGAGTYIRAIARDAGEALGVGGHLRALRRTRVGPHAVDRAVPLDALGDGGRVGAAMLTPLDAVSHLPRVPVDEDGIAALRYGRALPAAPETPEGTPLALASEDGALLAIGERFGDAVRPRKVFVQPAA
ncbi:MAG TPA: tRNA pseudouridine(55) synthase TruB [Longimicrobium sp.]|jgi:tRNA pseudouridine55 synthase|nr:tRNA pseudouridine(55) synthase TruB [Longimicrobium sp.]